MTTLSKEEALLVETTQAGLAFSKKAAGEAAAMADEMYENMKQLATINRDAERLVASNAAMRMQGALDRFCGAMRAARGELIIEHAIASDALEAQYDDGGRIVIMGGGGR